MTMRDMENPKLGLCGRKFGFFFHEKILKVKMWSKNVIFSRDFKSGGEGHGYLFEGTGFHPNLLMSSNFLIDK